MNISLSKAEEIDGDVTILGREVTGMMQIYYAPMNNGGKPAVVSNVGTLIVEKITSLQSRLSLSGVVSSLDDITIDGDTAPKILRVSGKIQLQIGSKKTFKTFEGVIHTTGYFREAWEAVSAPEWNGGRSF